MTTKADALRGRLVSWLTHRDEDGQAESTTRALFQYRRKLGGVLRTDGRHKKALEALKRAGQEEERILTEEAFRMLGLSPQSLTEVGEAVQRDLRDWQDAHEDVGPGLQFPAVLALYTKARRIAQPRFEIADLKRAAQDSFEIADLERAVQDMPRDAQGPSDEDADYLCRIAAKILLVHPDLPSVTVESGRTDHAFDQLQAFREQIFELTQFHTEQRAAVLARDLYEVVAKIIRTPINDDPAFLEAWQAADRRFEPLPEAHLFGRIEQVVADRICCPRL